MRGGSDDDVTGVEPVVDFDIDEKEKRLYAEEKGVTVFAIYSNNNPDNPTVLYAAKGKNADRSTRNF